MQSACHEALALATARKAKPSLLERLSSQPVGQKKTSKQCSENCQSNNQCDSDNIILRHKRKPIHQHSQFSQHLSGGARGRRGQIACAMHVAAGAVPATAAMDSASVVSPIVNLRPVITEEVDRQRDNGRGL